MFPFWSLIPLFHSRFLRRSSLSLSNVPIFLFGSLSLSYSRSISENPCEKEAQSENSRTQEGNQFSPREKFGSAFTSHWRDKNFLVRVRYNPRPWKNTKYETCLMDQWQDFLDAIAGKESRECKKFEGEDEGSLCNEFAGIRGFATTSTWKLTPYTQIDIYKTCSELIPVRQGLESGEDGSVPLSTSEALKRSLRKTKKGRGAPNWGCRSQTWTNSCWFYWESAVMWNVVNSE